MFLWAQQNYNKADSFWVSQSYDRLWGNKKRTGKPVLLTRGYGRGQISRARYSAPWPPEPLLSVRCAIYTRKSHPEGLEQDFNTLDAQRESAENYIASQKHQGWTALPECYDDGGFTGGNMDRPALARLLLDIQEGRVDCVVLYRVDRLCRSIVDFGKIIEIFDEHDVSFVSVTEQFSTATPTGRLHLNMLLSFAQYEREIIAERIRDKIAAAKRRGKYCGGMPVLGYDVDREAKRLVVNDKEARLVRKIFKRFCEVGSTTELDELA